MYQIGGRTLELRGGVKVVLIDMFRGLASYSHAAPHPSVDHRFLGILRQPKSEMHASYRLLSRFQHYRLVGSGAEIIADRSLGSDFLASHN